MLPIGEIAALFTSLCWSLAAVGFTKGSQQVGAQVTNRVRVLLALLALVLINAILYGQPVPLHAGAARWAWLAVSASGGFLRQVPLLPVPCEGHTGQAACRWAVLCQDRRRLR